MATMGFITQSTKQSNRLQNNLVPINFTHAHAIGQTGCGKTTSFIYPNLDHRIEQGHSVLLYDFKGKEHMSMKYFAQKHNRLSEVIEIGKPWGAKINLLRLFNRADLEVYLTNTMGLSKDNSYWSKTSVTIALSVYDVVRSLEKFINMLSGARASTVSLMDDLRVYPHSMQLSFETIFDICKSATSMSDFTRHINNVKSSIAKRLPKIIEKKTGSKETVKIVHAYNVFLKSVIQIERTMSEFSDYNKGRSSSTTFQAIALALGLPLSNIASYSELNEDGVDIVEALNNGALVSIDAQMMSETMLTSINYALFSQFTQRKMMMQTQPISIFIDEAQRVLSKDDDLPIDVLRECKVELLLSYQNEDLMIKKLGINNYEALKKNLSYTVLYTNPDNAEVGTSELKEFEYYCHQDNYQNKQKAQSLFIDEEELYATEYIFQNSILDLSRKYILDKELKNQVFVFNSRLYVEDTMLLVDASSLKTQSVGFMQKEDHDSAVRIIQDLKSKKQVEVDVEVEPIDFKDMQDHMHKFIAQLDAQKNASA